jgi:hypothetical protein
MLNVLPLKIRLDEDDTNLIMTQYLLVEIQGTIHHTTESVFTQMKLGTLRKNEVR